MNDETQISRLALLLGAALGALTLQACNKTATAASGPATGATPPTGALALDPSGLPSAPAPTALPPAPPAPISYVQAPRQRYRYVDRAAAMNSAFADSPPDYAVDYEGSRPWVWRARDGARRVIEHTADGDRFYYYAPGADEPYLVRGPNYAYGYDQGRLAAVYDSQGRALDDTRASAQAERAGEYLSRARRLTYAAEHARHEAAMAADWRARRDAQFADERQWEADQRNQADWRAWHEQNAYQSPSYQQEHSERVAYAAAIGAAAVGAMVAGHDHRSDDRRAGPSDGERSDRSERGSTAAAGSPDPHANRNPHVARAIQTRQGQVPDAARQQEAQAASVRQARQAAEVSVAAEAHQRQVQVGAAREAQAPAARQQQAAAALARQAQEGQARNQAEVAARQARVARAQAAQAGARQAEEAQARGRAQAAVIAAHQAQAAQAGARQAREAQVRNQARAAQAVAHQAEASAQHAHQARAQAAAKAHAAQAAAAPPAPATAKSAENKAGPPAHDHHGDHNVAQP